MTGAGRRTTTHEGVIALLPDIRWETLQQPEPVILGLPKYVQDRSFQGLAYRRESHDSGFRIRGREETCNGFDDPFVLKQPGDPISLRPQHRAGACAYNLVVGMGHIRILVVADEGGNSMDFNSRFRVKGPMRDT